MITKDMIRIERDRHQIGDEIVIRTWHMNSEDGKKKTPCFKKFRIVDKNQRMMLLDNGKYRVTVTYAELISNNLNPDE